MSYTTLRQPQGKPVNYINLIREALIAEVVAINDYNYHINNTDIRDLKEIWHHIMEEEKEHYGMFLELSRKYDPVQCKKYLEVKDKVKISSNIKLDNYKPEIDKQLILNNIRSDIKGELEAIILYEQHLSQIPYKDVRDVFKKVISDEKEHAEELTVTLLRLDRDKYGPLK